MTLLEKYAQVIIEMVNLQEGQNLLVRTEPVHWRFAAVIAAEAYKRGAKYVRVDSNEVENPYLYKARVENSREEYLTYVPKFRTDMYKTMLEEKWALIALKGEEDPDSLTGLDPKKNSTIAKAVAEAKRPFSKEVQNNAIQWLVVFAPSRKAAVKIMKIDDPDKALEKLWEVLTPILRLDSDNPAALWKKNSRELKRRAEVLNSMKIKTIRFLGPGTDLKIGLNKKAVWKGGSSVAANGVEFSPNIPTEEIFTTPDFRTATGRVAVTRPVLVPVLGKIMEGAWMEFKEGKVIDFGAEQGKDVLEEYFSMDPAARYLGEVALVDSNSPIFRSGIVFYNILFDENASCHIALGAAYPECIEGGGNMSEEELKTEGANISNLHTDFMIGSPDVDVTAETYSGEKVELIKKGFFVI